MEIEIKPLDQCKTLQDLFADPKRWTAGNFARDFSGKGVSSYDKEAVSFCLIGGLNRIYTDMSARLEALGRIRNEVSDSLTELFSFNDESSYEDIRLLVKKLNI